MIGGLLISMITVKCALVFDSAFSVSHLTAIFQLQMDTIRISRLMTTVHHTSTDTLCNTIRDMNDCRAAADHLEPLNVISL